MNSSGLEPAQQHHSSCYRCEQFLNSHCSQQGVLNHCEAPWFMPDACIVWMLQQIQIYTDAKPSLRLCPCRLMNSVRWSRPRVTLQTWSFVDLGEDCWVLLLVLLLQCCTVVAQATDHNNISWKMVSVFLKLYNACSVEHLLKEWLSLLWLVVKNTI